MQGRTEQVQGKTSRDNNGVGRLHRDSPSKNRTQNQSESNQFKVNQGKSRRCLPRFHGTGEMKIRVLTPRPPSSRRSVALYVLRVRTLRRSAFGVQRSMFPLVAQRVPAYASPCGQGIPSTTIRGSSHLIPPNPSIKNKTKTPGSSDFGLWTACRAVASAKADGL